MKNEEERFTKKEEIEIVINEIKTTVSIIEKNVRQLEKLLDNCSVCVDSVESVESVDSVESVESVESVDSVESVEK